MKALQSAGLEETKNWLPSCKRENDIFHICVTLLQCQPKITKTGVLKFWMQHELQVQANMLHNDF